VSTLTGCTGTTRLQSRQLCSCDTSLTEWRVRHRNNYNQRSLGTAAKTML